MPRPIAIDLFSGCGGMSLGLEAAGFDIAASVELDPIHSLVHHFNFPHTLTICQDLKNVKSAELMEKLINKIPSQGFNGEIDLIAGGPPCQGFSYIGKRQLDDPRNALVFEYVRIIQEIKPKYFIFENVPGIGSGKHKQFLEELMEEFETMGYTFAQPIKILDAALFGAPQKRKRLILIGSRNDVTKADYPCATHSLETTTNKDNNKLELTYLNPNTTADAISDLATIPPFIGTDKGVEAAKLDYSGFRKNFALAPSGEYKLCHIRQTAVPYSSTQEKLIWGHLGSQHTAKTKARFSATKPGSIDKISRFFKLSPSGLCNTLRAGTGSDKGAYTAPRPIHYARPRCITVREAARLHGFPDWFQFHRTIWHGFREIGNAVVPLLAKALGREIIKCLNIEEETLEIRQLPGIDSTYLSYNMTQAANYWKIARNNSSNSFL